MERTGGTLVALMDGTEAVYFLYQLNHFTLHSAPGWDSVGSVHLEPG